MTSRAIRPTPELLAMGYVRWFDPLYAYVSRHVADRHVRERIVREVLAENLDLLVGRRPEASGASRLRTAANRLIAEVMTGEEPIRSLPHGLACASAHPRCRGPETMNHRLIPPTADLLADGYDRWSDPLYAYVSRSVAGRQVRERIVSEVLSENLDLLVGRREGAAEVSRLTAAADRLIADAVTDANLFLDRRRLERSERQRPR